MPIRAPVSRRKWDEGVVLWVVRAYIRWVQGNNESSSESSCEFRRDVLRTPIEITPRWEYMHFLSIVLLLPLSLTSFVYLHRYITWWRVKRSNDFSITCNRFRQLNESWGKKKCFQVIMLIIKYLYGIIDKIIIGSIIDIHISIELISRLHDGNRILY